MRSVRNMYGDGNCLFRAFSYILTESEDQHLAVRYAALEHMINNAQYFLGHHLTGHNSVQSYIASTGMDRDGTWGTDIEMLSLADLFQPSTPTATSMASGSGTPLMMSTDSWWMTCKRCLCICITQGITSMWLVLLEELKTTTEPLSTVGEEEGGSILFEVASPYSYH